MQVEANNTFITAVTFEGGLGLYPSQTSGPFLVKPDIWSLFGRDLFCLILSYSEDLYDNGTRTVYVYIIQVQ